MLFHLEVSVRDGLGPTDTPAIQKRIGEWIVAILESGKVKDSGNYADTRGGFFVIEIDSPEDLKRLITPILDVASVNAHPILPMDVMQKLFQEMAK